MLPVVSLYSPVRRPLRQQALTLASSIPPRLHICPTRPRHPFSSSSHGSSWTASEWPQSAGLTSSCSLPQGFNLAPVSCQVQSMVHAPTSGGYWLRSISSGARFFDARFFLRGALPSSSPRRPLVRRFALVARFCFCLYSSADSPVESSSGGESRRWVGSSVCIVNNGSHGVMFRRLTILVRGQVRVGVTEDGRCQIVFLGHVGCLEWCK